MEEQVWAWRRGGTSGRGEVVEKGCRIVNMVQILCTHVCESYLLINTH
jgi:hypothetical protein